MPPLKRSRRQHSPTATALTTLIIGDDTGTFNQNDVQAAASASTSSSSSSSCRPLLQPSSSSSSTSASASSGEMRLNDGYEPQPFDVICRRDRERIDHVGNHRFRICVEMRVDRYLAAKTRTDKTMILREIIDSVRESGGRFIRPEEEEDVEEEEDDGESNTALRRRRRRRRRRQQQHQYDDDRRNYDQVKKKTTTYYDIGSKKTADKVGHAMRQAMAAARDSITSIISRRCSWPCPLTVSSHQQQQRPPSSPSPAFVHGEDTQGGKRRASLTTISYHFNWTSTTNPNALHPFVPTTFANITAASSPVVGASLEPIEPSWVAIRGQSPNAVSDAMEGNDGDDTLSSNNVAAFDDDDQDDQDDISLSSNGWDLSILNDPSVLSVQQPEQDGDECSFCDILFSVDDKMF